MRKILFIMTLVMFFIGGTTLFAQNEKQEIELKQDIDSINKIESELNKKEKSLKKELSELESRDVSEVTKRQFKEDFNDVKYVRWTKLEESDEATFINNGLVSRAYYNSLHELMGTITIKMFSDLPEEAQNKVNEEFSDYEKIVVIFYDDNELTEANIFLFDQEIREPDTYFVELRKDGSNIVLGFREQGRLVFNKKIKNE